MLQAFVEAERRAGGAYDILKDGYNGSGHFNRCPNGHLYTIADCGGAVQEGKCPDCGAAIGGSGHRLRSDNRKAHAEVLQLLQKREAA